MPAFLRPESSLPLETLRLHNDSTLPLPVLEALAASGLLDAQSLIERKDPYSHSPTGLPRCALTEVLRWPRTDDVTWSEKVTPELMALARSGSPIENGPRADERVWLWALDGQSLDPLLQAHLVQVAVQRNMPWGLAGLLEGWKPEVTNDLRKALKEALKNAIASDQPGLISPLATHALKCGWTELLGTMVKDAKGPAGAKALIEAADAQATPDASRELWEEWARQWHWDMALTLGTERAFSGVNHYKERHLLAARISPHLLPWALERLKGNPDHAVALGRTMAARLMTADSAEFNEVATDYAQHWKRNGWAPDEHFPLGLAGTFTALPLLKEAPGRRMHRLLVVAQALEQHQVGTPEQRRHVQAQLHWLQRALEPSLTKDFHRERFQQFSRALNLSTEECIAALESSTPSLKPISVGKVLIQSISGTQVARAALDWVVQAPLSGPEAGRVLAAVNAVLTTSSKMLSISPDQADLESKWFQRLSAKVEQGDLDATDLLGPLLDLVDDLVPKIRIKPEEREDLWARALEPHDAAEDTRVALVRTLRIVAQAGGRYPEDVPDTHRLYPFHERLKEMSLGALLPAPQPRRVGPRF
jgi:hypothetical protein